MHKVIGLIFSAVLGLANAQIVGFSSDEEVSAKKLVLTTISSAKKSLVIAAYQLTDKEIITQITNAHAKGINVQIILDRTQKGNAYLLEQISLFKINCLMDHSHRIMHDKYIIVDEATVLTGSYNYTKNAALHNAENVIVLENKTVAIIYLNHFVAVSKGATPC